MNDGGTDGGGPARADDAFGADLYRVLADAGTAGAPDKVSPAALRAGGSIAASVSERGAEQRLIRRAPGNLVFSPASIAAALRMALLGARGETAAELARALHLSGPEAAAAGLRLLGGVLRGSLDQAAAAGREDFTFRTPNTMWVQSGLPLQPEFLAAITDEAAAAVHDADFVHEHEKARKEINRVIAEQTAERIRDLLAPGVIDSATRLVLASAIYLKAAWAHPFPETATDDAPFYLEGTADGATVTVPMMQVTGQFSYAQGDGYQAVVLPYVGGRLAMAVVLPDGRLAPLAERLSHGGATGGMQDLLAGVTQARVQLSLPRFRFRRKFDLVGALRQLGVIRAFGGADFSGITNAASLEISAVEHEAYLDVNEKGTEAAAATAIAMRAMALVRQPPPVTMTVDRPFLFAIIDIATGLPLFLGQVADPTAG